LDDDGKTKITLYSYDYENRLIQVNIQGEDKQKIVSFTYDPFGRRISKSVQYSSLRGEAEAISDDDDDREKDDHDYENPKTIYYVYDNEDIISEYNSKGRITARYTHGLGIDEPLAVRKKDNIYYYHADGLGSITALTDKYGKVAQTYSYDSFGGFKKSGDKVKDMYTFTGRIWDNDIKLYDYRNRMYDPKIGRFTAYDPSLYLRGSPEIPYLRDAMLKSPQELNPYLYTANNPINKIDPMGLKTCCDNYCSIACFRIVIGSPIYMCQKWCNGQSEYLGFFWIAENSATGVINTLFKNFGCKDFNLSPAPFPFGGGGES
ncbi:MAG: hypothetical protein EPN22_08485, partial [Nitrospirae bacterium]